MTTRPDRPHWQCRLIRCLRPAVDKRGYCFQHRAEADAAKWKPPAAPQPIEYVTFRPF